MANTTKNFRDLDRLSSFIRATDTGIILCSGKTSTVINYENLSDGLLVDLSQMSGRIQLLNNGNLFIQGGVTWKEAREFCHSKGFDIKTAPTEDLAHVLAGLATSATGERSFGLGTIRNQVRKITFMNSNGDLKELHYDKLLIESKIFKDHQQELEEYQKQYEVFKDYKNAPFPRMKYETDLMIGTEGQLGIITQAEISIHKLASFRYFLLKMEPFEKSTAQHMEIFKKVQKFKKDILACEFIDSNSLGEDYDSIFLEVYDSSFEKIYENFICDLKSVNEGNIFELPRKKYKEIRESVPRKTNEFISRNGLVKKGTDCQALAADDFEKLLIYYKELANKGVSYQLFGHFGDGHLHFNFLPRKEELLICDKSLQEFYKLILKLRVSAFAEHGIGIIKQKYITDFYKNEQIQLFKILKDKLDPRGIFFPSGYMNLKGNHD